MTDIERFRNPNAQAPGCGVNQLLAQLGSQGSLHSEGQFTLSLENALEKLKQFQLSDPNLYVLNLVSVATLVGAVNFNVLLSRAEDTISFDGKLFAQAELENIFVSDNLAVKELAVALTAVKALNYESFTFESEGGLVWTDKTPEFFHSGSRTNVLTMVKKSKRSFSGPKEWSRVWSERSGTVLRRSCQLAPLCLKLNHRQVNKNVLQIEAPALKIEDKDFRLPTIKKVGRRESEIVTLSSNGKYSALVYGDASGESGWQLVFRGISYSRTAKNLGLSGIGGIVVSDGFTKDISHTDIAENDFFRKIVEDLQEMLVVYVKDHLTRKSLQRSEAPGWLDSATLVGQILARAGENREAARVDAWTYGHRAKLRKLTVSDCRNLVDRYDQRLVFLLDYFYWNSLLGVENQLKTLSGRLVGLAVSDEALLLPWIEGARPEGLLLLFEFLLPALPNEIRWKTLEPVESVLSRQLSPEVFRVKVLEPVVKAFESIQGGVREPTSLLQLASYVHSRGYLDFGPWLENAFASGLVSPDPKVRDWLRDSVHHNEARVILERLDADKRRQHLGDADREFARLLQEDCLSTRPMAEHLQNALRWTEGENEQSELAALLCLVNNSVSERFVPCSGAWRLHRAALVQALKGDASEARLLHEKAHRKLADHWFSHLLLADSALAQPDTSRAHDHYVRSFELRPCCATQESVIETSPVESQQEQWLSLARSLSVNKLESYFAYREAMELPVLRDFAAWVKLRALLSLAEHRAGEIPALFGLPPFLYVALCTPSVVRAKVRELRRKGEKTRSTQLLARFRVAQQLSLTVPLKLRWKEEYTDGEDSAPAPEPEIPTEREKEYPTRFEPLR